MSSIEGVVLRIIYQQSGYVVGTMSVHRSEGGAAPATATFAGTIYGLIQLKEGVSVGLTGEWGTHPKYGAQLKLSSWSPYARNPREAGRFLTDCVEGWQDWTVTDTVCNAFDNPFQALSQRPDEVLALAPEGDPMGPGLRRALSGWREAVEQTSLAAFLHDAHLRADVIRAVYRMFGLDAMRVLADNPYRLVAVPGFSFAQADTLALAKGIPTNDQRRVEGAILYVLHQEAQQGNLCVPRAMIPTRLNEMAQSDVMEPFGSDLGVKVTDALERMVEDKVLYLDSAVGVYLPTHWRHERESARILSLFVKEKPTDEGIDVPAFLAEYEEQNRLTLSPMQKEGVASLLKNRVLVLTGLPGTGKTTLVRVLVALFKKIGRAVTLMAPTGIAAKRLSSVTGHPAATIHRTLRYDGDAWGYNVTNKLTTPAVIVDEMSMVDQELLYRLLDALHPQTYLVMVGDDAQLPSVGPGNVLRELIGCPSIPGVKLTQIFRQAHTSEIVLASHQVHRGELLNLSQPKTSEFQFAYVPDENVLVDLLVAMALKLKARNANFQVLSPKYDGATGVTNLNDRLREALNPDNGQAEWKAGALHVRVGDRVMIVKNDYELGVYNGDMGKVTRIDKDDITLRIHGIGAGVVDTVVELDKSRALEVLRLAYAITVHKSQGSEFDTVIFPVVRSQGRMLQRNLLYTALTRAKSKAWLLGDPSAVQKAVANDKVVYRHTGFGQAVEQALAGVDRGGES